MKTPFQIFQQNKHKQKNGIKQNIIKMKPYYSKQFEGPSTILIESFNQDKILYKTHKPYKSLTRKDFKSFLSLQRQAKSERLKDTRVRYKQKTQSGKKQIRLLKTSHGNRSNIGGKFDSPKIKQVKSQLEIDSFIAQEAVSPTYNQFKEQYQIQNKSVNLEDCRGKRIHSTIEDFITISSPYKKSIENAPIPNKLQIFQNSLSKKTNTLNCQQLHLKTKQDFIADYMIQVAKGTVQQKSQHVKNDQALTNFIKACRKKRVRIQQRAQLKSNKITEIQMNTKRTIGSSPAKSKRQNQETIRKKQQERQALCIH